MVAEHRRCSGFSRYAVISVGTGVNFWHPPPHRKSVCLFVCRPPYPTFGLKVNRIPILGTKSVELCECPPPPPRCADRPLARHDQLLPIRRCPASAVPQAPWWCASYSLNIERCRSTLILTAKTSRCERTNQLYKTNNKACKSY